MTSSRYRNHDKADRRHTESLARMALCLQLISAGRSVYEAIADPRIGVSYSAYRKWRERNPTWAAEVDIARKADDLKDSDFEDLTSAQFALRYFGRIRAPFQQRWINTMEAMRPGNILLALWPPEHGKTTTFEDYATERICRDPQWRSTIVGGNGARAKSILARVRNRLEPEGPFPQLVKEWGPFRPDAGRSRAVQTFSQPWNNTQFNVLAKRLSDERDHNMLAMGWKTDILSIRTDQLHIDDLQSTKTIGMTEAMLEWFRQDGLSRAGETGRTTLNGSRVGDNDFWVTLEDDPNLEGILETIKIKAIVTNHVTGEREPAWPEKFSMEGLDRIRRKAGDEAFDRNYMMQPGASQTRRTFTDEGKALSLANTRRLNQFHCFDGRPTVCLALDPGLNPGKTHLQGWVMEPDKMRLVYLFETDQFMRNEQIIDCIDGAADLLGRPFRVAHLTIEAMNFQRGLARDERLMNVRRRHSFTMGEHLTGINKYDENIGLASMAGDWQSGKIELPYGDDQFTRTNIDELCRQMKGWKPGLRGTKYRQDGLMAMWFAWIWWQEHRKHMNTKTPTWRRAGLPYAPTPALILPTGARV